MSQDPQFVAEYRDAIMQITDQHGTRPRLVCKGGAAVAYSSSDPTVYREGGSRIHALSATTNDTANNTCLLGKARSRTLVADMGTASIATTSTITRSSGSFVTDGFLVGQRIAILPTAAESGANLTTAANGQICVLTAVAATTLTVSGTPLVVETILAGFAIYQLTQLGVTSVPLNSGFASGVPAVSLLSPSVMPWVDDTPNRFMTLGPNEWLWAAAGTALGAGEVMDISAMLGDY